MKSFFSSAIFATALLVAGVSAQSLTINTPTNVIECNAIDLTFTGGSPDYTLTLVIWFDVVVCILISVSTFSVYPGATPDGTPLATFFNITGSPFVWTAVNFAAGTSLDLTLRDSTGLSAQSAVFTVIAGSSTSCLNGTASGSNGGTNTPAASTPSNTAATTTGTTPANTKTGSGTTATSTSSSTPSSKNAAIIAGVPYGLAAVLGAVVAAVL